MTVIRCFDNSWTTFTEAVGDAGNKPDSEPSYLWIGIRIGIGFLFLLAVGLVPFLFSDQEGDSEVPPLEASSREASVPPVEERVEAFNPVASSGDENESGDQFGVASDEAQVV
jgi:hypothetical protein